MNPKDVEISRNFGRVLRKVVKLVEKELRVENMGVSLILHPKTTDGGVREMQYISNLPRTHMLEAMKALVKQWDTGATDILPHERN